MRTIPLLLLGAALASCSATATEPVRTAGPSPAATNLLAGKIAARPVNCLPNYNANEMSVIDSRNVAFRVGGTVYLMQLSDGCGSLGQSGYAMLTKQYGAPGLCHGDIVQVIDTMNRMLVGSCNIGEIVPYARPASR